jgi:hypothetical protein
MVGHRVLVAGRRMDRWMVRVRIVERLCRLFFDRHRIGRAVGMNGHWIHGEYLLPKRSQDITMSCLRLTPACITMFDSMKGIRMLPTPVVAALVAPLVMWRVYHRVRRLTVRQQSHIWRHRISLFVFPPLLLWMLVAGSGSALALAGLIAGVMGGSLLGVAGLNKTVFERTGDEFYYTPFAPIGIAVAALFLVRLAYRGIELYTRVEAHQDFARSPLTLLVFGILAGYYMTYSSGLLRWRKQAADN